VLLKRHEQAWAKLWRKFDIQVEGDDFSQRVLRLHIFHLLQTASMHNSQIDAGLPARGLHGEAYRGHVFWDEIFAMFFYDMHMPEVSRALLLYRYRRLTQARESAKKAGYSGAMFPWQSGSSGKEETQVIHLNPMSGRWGPDYSFLQRHVSFAVAYNTWQYYQRTGDFDFLRSYGAEMLLSIAQFAASLAKFSPKDKRYHTKKLMGPDEFHEALPGSSQPGFRDNAYSNLMIVWTLLKAQEALSVLPEASQAKILKRIRLSRKELERWDDIARRMKIIINRQGIISQFEGYFGLRELDWEKYKSRYGNIRRMDRILKSEGESPNDYKVAKQADALMFFYLFSLPEIEAIFQRLGYKMNKGILRKNYQYYLKRTSHGSTLSKVVYCYLAHLLGGTRESWQWYQDVLRSDLYDTQGNTTHEGIHAGIMAGSIDIAMRGFAGISLQDDIIRINPRLPRRWQGMKLRFCHKKIWFSLSINKSKISLLIKGPAGKFLKIPIEINHKIHNLALGKTCRFSLHKK
jgi:trehalose/maltose hydrolase-like predicted phosphorylase